MSLRWPTEETPGAFEILDSLDRARLEDQPNVVCVPFIELGANKETGPSHQLGRVGVVALSGLHPSAHRCAGIALKDCVAIWWQEVSARAETRRLGESLPRAVDFPHPDVNGFDPDEPRIAEPQMRAETESSFRRTTW